MQRGIDGHKEYEHISLIFLADQFGGQRNLYLSGFGRAGTSNPKFGRAIPDRTPLRSIGSEFLDEPAFGTKRSRLFDAAGQKFQQCASARFQDVSPLFDSLERSFAFAVLEFVETCLRTTARMTPGDQRAREAGLIECSFASAVLEFVEEN